MPEVKNSLKKIVENLVSFRKIPQIKAIMKKKEGRATLVSNLQFDLNISQVTQNHHKSNTLFKKVFLCIIHQLHKTFCLQKQTHSSYGPTYQPNCVLTNRKLYFFLLTLFCASKVFVF